MTPPRRTPPRWFWVWAPVVVVLAAATVIVVMARTDQVVRLVNSAGGWFARVIREPDQLQALVGLITAVGVLFSILWAIHTHRDTKKSANAAASRAEAAASVQDEQTSRIADALAVLAHSVPRVPWTVELDGWNDAGAVRYRLTNRSQTLRARTVVLESPGLRIVDDNVSHESFAPGDAQTFAVHLVKDSLDNTVLVLWRDDSDSTKQQRWRYPLPQPQEPQQNDD